MGKVFTFLVLAGVLWAGVAAAQSAAGAASGSGETVTNTVLARVPIEDVTGHELVQSTGLDQFATPDPIAGVSFQGAQMKTHSQSDLVDGSGLVRGYGVWQAASGERLFLTYGYRIPPRTPATSEIVPFEGSFEWTDGTGHLEKVQGSGTIEGRIARNGRATYRWSGTYREVVGP